MRCPSTRRSAGKDFCFIDFDGGDKEMSYEGRRRKRSPFRDLASSPEELAIPSA